MSLAKMHVVDLLECMACIGVLVLAPAAVAPNHAVEAYNTVREGQAVMTELSADANAITYWVSESDGWHVVTTVDTRITDGDDEKHAVVRFSSVLLPGQSQQISVPVAIGEQQQVISIRRVGDQIEVGRVPGSA